MVLENIHTPISGDMNNLRVWESKRLKLFKERIKLNWNYQRKNIIFPGKFSQVRPYL